MSFGGGFTPGDHMLQDGRKLEQERRVRQSSVSSKVGGTTRLQALPQQNLNALNQASRKRKGAYVREAQLFCVKIAERYTTLHCIDLIGFSVCAERGEKVTVALIRRKYQGRKIHQCLRRRMRCEYRQSTVRALSKPSPATWNIGNFESRLDSDCHRCRL